MRVVWLFQRNVSRLLPLAVAVCGKRVNSDGLSCLSGCRPWHSPMLHHTELGASCVLSHAFSCFFVLSAGPVRYDSLDATDWTPTGLTKPRQRRSEKQRPPKARDRCKDNSWCSGREKRKREEGKNCRLRVESSRVESSRGCAEAQRLSWRFGHNLTPTCLVPNSSYATRRRRRALLTVTSP